MGERGPAPDPDQAVKGFPARRRGRAAKAAREAAELARLLAPSGPAPTDLPPMLADAKYAPAAEVWKKLAPELRRTHRLPPEAEFQFVQFCIYAQEWAHATEDLHVKGFTQAVATVAGGKMERRRPQNLDRQQAFANCMELSARFGLTPHDMYALFKDQANAATKNPWLFDAAAPGELPLGGPAEDPAPATGGGRIGSLSAAKGAPPGARPN